MEFFISQVHADDFGEEGGSWNGLIQFWWLIFWCKWSNLYSPKFPITSHKIRNLQTHAKGFPLCLLSWQAVTTCVSQVTFRKNSHHFWPFFPSWVFQNHFVSVLCCHCKRYHKLTGVENTHLSPYNFCRLGIWSGPYCCWHPCSFLKALKDRSFSLPFPVSKKPTFLGLRSPFLSSEPAMASWDPFASCNSNNLFCLPLSLWLYGTYPGNPG